MLWNVFRGDGCYCKHYCCYQATDRCGAQWGGVTAHQPIPTKKLKSQKLNTLADSNRQLKFIFLFKTKRRKIATRLSGGTF